MRAFPEDIKYFDSLVNDRDIQNRPQAIRRTIEKAEKYDYMMSMEENDLK